MMRKNVGWKYENIVLQVLYEQQPGTSISDVDDLRKLGGSKFDTVDRQALLNIIGGHAGLVESGFVAGKVLPGNNPGEMPWDVYRIALTTAGRKHIEDSSFPARAWIVIK